MIRLLQIPLSAFLLLSSALNASAHGGGEHHEIVVPDDADWATRHMAGKNAPLLLPHPLHLSTSKNIHTEAILTTNNRGAPHLRLRRRHFLHPTRL